MPVDQLQEQWRLLHEILDRDLTAIALMDRSGRYVLVNRAFQQFAPAKEMVGHLYTEVWAEIAEGLQGVIERVLQTGEEYRAYDQRLPIRRGPTDPLEERYFSFAYSRVTLPGGEPGMLTLAHETTRVVRDKQQIERLAEDAGSYANEVDAILEALADPLIVYDLDGRPLRFNQAAIDLVGFDPREVTREEGGRRVNLRDLDGTPLRQQDYASVRALSGTPVSGQRLLITTARGEERAISASAAPLTRGGRVVGSVAVWRDVTEEHALQRELARTTARLTAIVESIGEAFFALDRDRRFTYVNERAGSLLQRRPDELLGRNVGDEFPDAIGTRVYDLYRQAMETGEPSMADEYYEPLGAWFEFRAYPFEDGLSVFFSDVTERRRAGEALRSESQAHAESERRLQAVLDTLPVGVFVADEKGAIVATNPAAGRIWGGKAPLSERPTDYGRYVGRWADTGETIDAEDWALARALHGEVSVGEIVDIDRFDGTSGTILNSAAPIRDGHGRVIGAVAAIQDITEYRRAQQELQRSRARERFLAQVITHSSQPFAEATTDSGRFSYVNPAFERMTGYTLAELTEKTVWDITPKEWHALEAAAFERLIETGEPQVYQKEYRRPDGSRFPVELLIHVARDEAGTPFAFYGFITDITERVRATQERERVLAELEAERNFSNTVLDVAGAFIVILDPNDYIIRMNRLAYQRVGLTREEVEGHRVDVLLPEDARSGVSEALRSVVAGDFPNTHENEWLSRSGERILLSWANTAVTDESGQVQYIVAVGIDITEQRRAEAERERLVGELREERMRSEIVARESLERASQLDSVFSSMADGVAIYDADARLLRWNDQAARIFGYVEEHRLRPMTERIAEFQLIDEHGTRLLPSEFPPMRALAGETVRNRVLRISSESRPAIALSISAAPIERDGNRVGAVATFLDVTPQYDLAERRDELARKLSEANREMTAVSRITDVAISILDLDSLMKALLEQLIDVMDADAGTVLLAEDGRIKAFASIGVEGEVREGFDLAIGEGFAGTIAATRQPRYVADAQESPLVRSPYLKAAGIRSMLGVPLQVGDALLGVLHVDWTRVHREDPREPALLQLAGERISLAIRNAQLYEERRRAAAFSAALNDIDTEISSTLDFDEILRRVVKRTADAVDADAATVFLAENGGWRLRAAHNVPERLMNHWFHRSQVPYSTNAEGTPDKYLLDNDVRSHEAYDDIFVGMIRATGTLDVALMIAGEPVAAFGLYHLDSAKRFNFEHADFLRKVATSLTLALQNARRYAEERDVADTLQRALLQLPKSIEGIRFECLYRSAATQASVGGDFYDLFSLDDGRVGLMIGDVSGKGLTASTLTSLVRNTVRAYAFDLHSPAAALAKANRVVYRAIPEDMFVTLIFGILDPASGELVYCNAGHPAALVLRRDALDEMAATSPLLGAVPNVQFRDARLRLEKGDVLFLYTDGVIEARCGEEFFGEERLRETILERQRQTTDELPQHVWRRLEEFVSGGSGDDVAMLSLKLDAMPR